MFAAPLWLPVTLVAALFQTWRTALQQRLRGQLSVNGAGVVRYLYGVPVGCALLAGWCLLTGAPPPALDTGFLVRCAAGGLAQVVGTNLLIMAFDHRGFAVGTAYAKTEAVQGAVLAWLLLGERLRPLAWVGIAVGVVGVLWLSLAGRRLGLAALARSAVQPAALCGLGAGFGFALAAVLLRAANLRLASDDAVLRGIATLAVTNLLQTLMQGAWLLWREPGQLRAVAASWRSSMQVGALSACGSACWFTAFGLAPVALVRTVGQVEILFTLGFSRFYLKERPSRTEVAAVLVVVAGVVIVLAAR